MKSLIAVILMVANLSLDDIILDIYNAVTEFGEVEYEQLQTDLYALHEVPINLNHTSDEELQQLYFLSPQQIDDILAYANRHPFESLYELRMIQSLKEYEIRDLLPFVRVDACDHEDKMYTREVFHYASHELFARVDARNIEAFEGTDPVYIQTRYRFDYKRRVTFGAQLRRPAGGNEQDLQYGAYLQLRDIGHLHTLVAGNYQASFGQGLVLAPIFHTGKTMYIQSTAHQAEGLRYYGSVDGEGLHGAGGTMRWVWGKKTRLDVSALYSMKRANDSTWHHLVGANMTFRHDRLQVQLTAIENIWTDSIHPYRDAAYNRHYFRGRRQAVIGASARYNYGWFDLFGEVAAAQNQQWGAGVIAGSRFYPTPGVSIVALYRYYSPWFDNELGYSFSEGSRIGDENGGYLGLDITRVKNWRFTAYGDVFYFSGPKYGIPNSPTIGYDAMAEAQYIRPTWRISSRLRARQKGATSTYSARVQADASHHEWGFRTIVDANYVQSYGLSVAQDISYSLPYREGLGKGLSLRLRLQFFDAREWANRIYLYEHDVLYAFSIPATYGLGGRAYLCLRWKILEQLSLYLRVSETVYAPSWARLHDRPNTRTDIHLLLRTTL